MYNLNCSKRGIIVHSCIYLSWKDILRFFKDYAYNDIRYNYTLYKS